MRKELAARRCHFLVAGNGFQPVNEFHHHVGMACVLRMSVDKTLRHADQPENSLIRVVNLSEPNHDIGRLRGRCLEFAEFSFKLHGLT